MFYKMITGKVFLVSNNRTQTYPIRMNDERLKISSSGFQYTFTLTVAMEISILLKVQKITADK